MRGLHNKSIVTSEKKGFYLQLANAADDEKLKGLSFCEVEFGQGKDEYYVEGDDDDESGEPNEALWNQATSLMDKIGELLPDARICYQSIESESTGETYIACKIENDPRCHCCSTLWENYEFGSDEWCAQVKKQAKKFEDFEDGLIDPDDEDDEDEDQHASE